MILLVCGGRDYKDQDRMNKVLSKIKKDWKEIEIIHGGASGADSLADDWARVHKVKRTPYYAKWKTHGKSADPIRNKQMLEDGKPDIVVAFPGGKGTENIIAIAEKAGVPVIKIG